MSIETVVIDISSCEETSQALGLSEMTSTVLVRSQADVIKSSRPENFILDAYNNCITRCVRGRDGSEHQSFMKITRGLSHKNLSLQSQLSDLYDSRFLACKQWPEVEEKDGAIRSVDLFSGIGAMSLGVWECCRAIGRAFTPVWAIDSSDDVMRLYNSNFGTKFKAHPIETDLDSQVGAKLSQRERRLKATIGKVDIAVGGPPCQGHSNLNNHTRRRDPRNALYLRMVRFAEVVMPENLIIENVSDVVRDHVGVVDIAKRRLEGLGYYVDLGTIDLSAIGVPQRRKRHFLVASLQHKCKIDEIVDRYCSPQRSVRWAIEDLLSVADRQTIDVPSKVTPTNCSRIDFLFKNRLYDLPNERRPDCHRLKQHSYKSVYGRLRWDSPAQTITSGFTSMGQGRYVHPARKRTLTPHEAARLQFIPDFFTIGEERGRTALAEAIGNAVPMKAVYILALELLR